ncbi:MAG: NAD(P)-dependent alcohol dehydrogenase [Acidimicrobiia bacterium]|nr:NAD(P)-dependent alcohol dehydrogenase [Acidimicrobiia bacterium]MDH3398347.1 NAD(P)-dependent alcohol dehydrogenase [Acidimicrobiia bacterium]
MQAVVYERFGPPEVLRVAEVPEPSPSLGEVKVRVRATSVNPMDVVFRSGELKGRMFSGILGPKVSILGTDMAGEVVALGEGVDDVQVGDRVVGITPGLPGGAYAEYLCVDASAVVTIPTEIGYAEAAAFSFAGLSSWLFLQKIGGMEAGRRVLIIGASGGLGTFAVQLAHHYGAEVTGVCSTRNVELVNSLGADEVIDYTRDDPTDARDAYDVIFDTVAVGSFGAYRGALRPGGVYSTTVMKPGVLVAMALNPLRRSGRRAHFMVGSGDPQEGLGTLRDLFIEGALRSVIELQLPLQQVVEGHRLYETGRTRGKIVLTV